MPRNLQALNLKQSYQTNPDDLAADFYAPLISQSVLIRRAVGYFRSTAYLLMHEEIVGFFRAGGRLEIVCSPEMAAEDIEALRHSVVVTAEGAQASIPDAEVRESFLNEIEEMAAAADGDLHLSLLGGMIQHRLAEFRIAIPLTGRGIYHEKRGIAVDELGQAVAFFGSANETMAGWGKDGNVEAIDVFRSWIIEDVDRTADHIEKFEQVWDGRREAVVVKSLPAAVQERLLCAAPPSQDEFYRTLRAYQRLRNAGQSPKTVSNPFDQVIAPPGQRQLDSNQVGALRAWLDAGCRGLLKLATGAGKTLTALRAVRLHTNEGLPVLILVPSKLLLRQWLKEIAEEIPDATVMLAGDGHARWSAPGRLEAFLSLSTSGERRILLSTMQTAASQAFRSRLKPHLARHLLLVADEVHQLGSLENRNLFRVQAGARLGLSATPERFGDPEGTALLMDYFGGVVGPVVTLADAIRSGRLVPYRYFPHFVSLSETEREQWAKISLQIRKAYGRAPRDGGGKPVETERIRLLKIQRSWIPKKASQKARITQRILRDRFEPGQHWLVYCEDQHQIEEVSDACRAAGIEPLAYHTAMAGDAEVTLEYFVKYGGVLLSIRCLDEGVDIPVISHAIILASSQNPRQFIQRRGRVLRSHPNKAMAEIHDVLVVPSSTEDNDQDSLTLSEFLRATEFAKDAINQADASLLRGKAIELGLSLADIYDTGAEEVQVDLD